VVGYDHEPRLCRFYEDTPEFAHAVIDVGPQLASILTALLRGYCAEASA